MNPNIKEALSLYVGSGIVPGSFLQACLANDFTGAVLKADPENLRDIREIASYIFNTLPGSCWGSYKAIAAYSKSKQAEMANI